MLSSQIGTTQHSLTNYLLFYSISISIFLLAPFGYQGEWGCSVGEWCVRCGCGVCCVCVYPSVFSLQNPKSFCQDGERDRRDKREKGRCLFVLFEEVLWGLPLCLLEEGL